MDRTAPAPADVVAADWRSARDRECGRTGSRRARTLPRPRPRTGRRRPAPATTSTGSPQTAASVRPTRDGDAGGLLPELNQRGHVFVTEPARAGLGEALLRQRA